MLLKKQVFLVALVAAASESCASVQNPLREVSPRTAAVTVENGHCADISVYATTSSARYRLGKVGMFSTRTFALPVAIFLPSEMSLYIIAEIDGKNFTSPPFLANLGDFFILSVQDATEFSTLLRR